MAKLFLAASIVALGAAILWAGGGRVGPFISSAVRGFGTLVGQVGQAASSPSPTAAPTVPDPPRIGAPEQPYTNKDTIDVRVTLPATVTGLEGYTIRLYVTLADQEPVLLTEVPVGALAVQTIAGVKLAVGRNDLQAAVNGPGGESERSEPATWIFDNSKPKVTVTSPKDGAKVTRDTVQIKGKSQPRSSIRLQNDANKAIATAVADKDGIWTTKMALAQGLNVITVIATDPAGNENSTTVSLRRGQGKLTVSLLGSKYKFTASKLPTKVTFTATVTGSDGRRLAGATALFTVSVPGLQAIVSSEVRTGSDGVATFSTTIPAGAMAGSGLATVMITSGQGSATDRAALTVE